MNRQKIILAVMAIVVGLGAVVWGVGAWIDAAVERRVDAAVERRVRTLQQFAAPAAMSEINRQPESIEDYEARVELAKRRLALRGDTDPGPTTIALELNSIRLENWEPPSALRPREPR